MARVASLVLWFLGSVSRVGGSGSFPFLVARVVFSLVCELTVLLFRQCCIEMPYASTFGRVATSSTVESGLFFVGVRR